MKVSLIIDGKEIKARTGMSVLEAARKEDIYIPSLCYHPQLESSGSCRLCVVEIEGMRGYPTACTTLVTDGMVVNTENKEIRSLRRNILELILSEHPHTCLICDKRTMCDDFQSTIRKVGVITGCQYCPKNGECELQQLVEYLDLKEMSFPITYRSFPVEDEDPFFDRDYNLCVLCGRCVRMCNDVRINGTLNFGFRGERTVVGTAFGKSHIDSGCEFCGACVDVCPTGALYDKRSKWEGGSDRSVQSVCPYCSVGCSLNFNIKGSRIVSTSPYVNGTLNKGNVCVRGRFGVVDMIHNSRRIQKPMVKQESRWRETNWNEALELVAEKFLQYKGDRFALIASPQCTNEDAYTLQKFTRSVMNSNNVICASEFVQDGYLETVFELRKQDMYLPSIADIGKVGVVVVWGADLSVSHPVAALKVKQVNKNGTKLVVIDPRRTKLALLSDVHVRVNPGTDRLLAAALLKLISYKERIEQSLLSNVDEWNNFHKDLELLDLSSIEKITGVPESQIKALHDIIIMNKPAVFLFGSGITFQESVKDNIFAISDLAVLINESKVLPVTGESNLMGCMEMGCHPRFLPGLLSIEDENARKKYEKRYGITIVSKAGLNMAGIIQGIEKCKIQSLYVAGEFPELDSLKKLDFLVVQSVFPPTWMDTADVILPAAHLAEVEGTITNFEGRIQRIHRVAKIQGDAKPDWWICSQIAQKMGGEGFSFKRSSDVFNEISSTVPEYSGISYRKLGEKGIVPWLYKISREEVTHKFYRFSIEKESAEPIDGYQFKLIINRNLSSYRNGSLIENISGMNRILSEGILEIHPVDAKKLNLLEGDSVTMESKDGFFYRSLINITEKVIQGMVYLWLDQEFGQGGLRFGKYFQMTKIQKVADE